MIKGFGPHVYEISKASLEYIGGLTLTGTLISASFFVENNPGTIFAKEHNIFGENFLLGTAFFTLLATSLYCADKVRSSLLPLYQPSKQTRQKSQNLVFLAFCIFISIGLIAIAGFSKTANILNKAQITVTSHFKQNYI